MGAHIELEVRVGVEAEVEVEGGVSVSGFLALIVANP